MKIRSSQLSLALALTIISPALRAQTGAALSAPAPAMATAGPSIAGVLASGVTLIGQTKVDLARVAQLYQLTGQKAIWVDGKGINEVGTSLRRILTSLSEMHGFRGSYYYTADADSRLRAADAKSLAELDVLLTQGYLDFMSNVATGRINPKDPTQNVADIEMKKNAGPALSFLASAVTNPDALINAVDQARPQSVAYDLLFASLVKLKRARDMGGWRPLKDRSVLKPGANSATVPAIRQRMVDLGYLGAEQAHNESPAYDADLVKAVMTLQSQSLLGADGVIGNSTYQILEVPLEARINQLRANMEKWRFMPRQFPNRFLLVDMGRQEIDAIENGTLADRMRVVVGKDVHGTPTMTDKVTQIIVNPYWYPPTSIVVNEMLPKMREGNPSDYLTAMHIRILSNGQEIDPNGVDWSRYTLNNPPPYTFRQDSGPMNSLGVVKFELTNSHAIYLHDTDVHSVFDRSVRYLSHGCIRLQRPLDLAAYLLRDRGMDQNWLQDETQNPDVHAERVPITPIPVFILGTTITSFPDGTIAFGPDIYGQDARIIDAMDGKISTAAAVAPTSQAQ